MQKITSFSNNIVFWDTEFNGNDAKKAELLSIAMVKYTGEELYLELDFGGEYDPWVKENVVPYLKDAKVSKEIAFQKIKEFVGDTKPYLISFISPFDYVYFSKLVGLASIKEVFHWPPIDFASILFGNNIDPESYYTKNEKNFFQEIGVDVSNFQSHKALDDAKMLREVYLKLIK